MNNLYNSYEGYIRGNAFKDLYAPYKNYEVYQLVPLNEYEEAWLNLSQTEFMMTELNLYLDIFPDDEQMINKFNEARETYNRLLESFTKNYGAIFTDEALSLKTPWIWVGQTWPWDGGNL